MIIHCDKPKDFVKNNYSCGDTGTGTSESDDNISIATYGTAKDYLDVDFESELNALAVHMNK